MTDAFKKSMHSSKLWEVLLEQKGNREREFCQSDSGRTNNGSNAICNKDV